MRAITITEPGGPDVLAWNEVPDPVPGAGEVLIRTAASAVNRADLLQRQGLYSPPAGASPYPGLEASGVDAATGEPVCALLGGGGYAELVAVPAAHTLPVPKGLSVEEAAALPEVACTVWSNLGHDLRGKTLLIHGGGSGIGTFAIQYGVALGATVVTTARKSKHDRLTELGAHRTIDYTDEDWAADVRADIILDIIGARYLARNVEALATGGRLAIIGMQGGAKAELDLRALGTKQGSISMTLLRARGHDEKAAIVRGVREHVWPLVESGAIKPVIYRRVPMSQAAEAHRIVEASDHLGKVLLTVS
ncbi:NAD(P)H-quinone oxidoreductase [Phytohabitans sp. LJ34]|uniref:NAD(P)H-quinone oxidoreductase n=1 Tax=Phytohabitans sp. LJ34 TaxID=3452217 RepID=UPI003F88A59E